MRAASILLFLCLTCAIATAGGRVVVMTDRDALPGALQLALANRSIDVAGMASPDGALRLDRAATVQRAAMSSAADAGIWIESDAAAGAQVCVVSSDGTYFRQAPLPTDASPRVFAAIATSLLDELLAPPEAGVAVDVHIGVQPPMVAAAGPSLAPVAQTTAVAPNVIDPARWRHTLLEIGPTFSIASYGIEAEIAAPVSESWRVGLLGGASELTDGIRDLSAGTQLYHAALEVRHVGTGTTHFDFGLAGGLATGMIVDDLGGTRDTGGFAAARVSVVHEYPSGGLSLSIVPMFLFDWRGQGDDRTPAVMGSLRWELPI
jgi:hypothetical protein